MGALARTAVTMAMAARLAGSKHARRKLPHAVLPRVSCHVAARAWDVFYYPNKVYYYLFKFIYLNKFIYYYKINYVYIKKIKINI